jgi:hypothetical protein
VANTTLLEPGANATSPTAGTIISWQYTLATGGPFYLRVLRPAGGASYTGSGISAPHTPISLATTPPIPTSLPIRKGDLVGLDNTAGGDKIGIAFPLPGAVFMTWSFPKLAEGETRAGVASTGAEWGFNAVVRYCLVPKLKGKTLKAARKALRTRDCAPLKLAKTKQGKKVDKPRIFRITRQDFGAGTSVSDRARMSVQGRFFRKK